jgi:hypothetical protein
LPQENAKYLFLGLATSDMRRQIAEVDGMISQSPHQAGAARRKRGSDSVGTGKRIFYLDSRKPLKSPESAKAIQKELEAFFLGIVWICSFRSALTAGGARGDPPPMPRKIDIR